MYFHLTEMSLKLKSTSQLMGSASFQIKEESEVQGAILKKKRAPAPLTISCPVCGGPAPDHIHFGGMFQVSKYLNFSASAMKLSTA